MAFPSSNLPASVQPWSRDVQKRIEGLERNVKSNEINGISRDVQLESNYKRLDKVVNDLVIADAKIIEAQEAADDAIFVASDAADKALIASSNALTASNLAITASGQAGAAATSATNTLNALIGLGSPGSLYPLNASNINAGTITGITINTAASPATRVSLNNDKVSFYHNSVNGGTTETGYIWGTSSAGMLMQTSGTGNILLGPTSVAITTTGTSPAIEATGTNIQLNKPVSTNDSLNVATNLNVDSNATVANRIFNVGGYNAVVANPTNMYIAANGAIARTTTTSSREAKKNIQPLEFSSDDFISVSPVTFDYKEGIITEGSGDGITGFIAEDFQELGFDELIIQKESEDDYIGLRYDKLYMFLHKVVAEQQERIKALEAKLGVQ